MENGTAVRRHDHHAVHVVWLAGGSCEGCTMAVLGATQPSIEELLLGFVPDAPDVTLLHPTLALSSGRAYMEQLEAAAAGELSRVVLVLEGSVFDEPPAGGGAYSRVGGADSGSVGDWVLRLAGVAEAAIAIGSCAASGGIPAARGSVTGAHGLEDHLGRDYRSRGGLPVVNVPGCAPSGDAFVETLLYVLLHLERRVPLELDAEHRPRWLYSHQVTACPPRTDAEVPGPVDDDAVRTGCPVPVRGWMRGIGGCARVGGACIGCTAPGFADRFLSAAASRRSS